MTIILPSDFGYTLREMLDAIQAFGFGPDTEDAQKAAINFVYRRVNGMRRWPWQQISAYSNLSVLATNHVMAPLPEDLLHLDAVRLEGADDGWELIPKSAQELRSLLHADRETGKPRYWSQVGRDIHVFPRADRTYTGVIDYIQAPPPLRADSDVANLPELYADILPLGALAQLAMRERDWDLYQAANGEFHARVREMANATFVGQRQQAEEVARSSFWDAAAGLN